VQARDRGERAAGVAHQLGADAVAGQAGNCRCAAHRSLQFSVVLLTVTPVVRGIGRRTSPVKRSACAASLAA
jgi:hypothetical protein